MPTLIMIVDDEPATNAFLSDYFRQLGYEVASAHDGADALEQIRRRPPALAVIDLGMPGMGGWELIRHIRADLRLRQMPLLICTGRKDARLPADMVQGIIWKPYRPEDVAQQVHAALSRWVGPQPDLRA